MHNRTAFPIMAMALGLLVSGCADLQHGWEGTMTEIGLYGPAEKHQPLRPMMDTGQRAASNSAGAEEPSSWCRQYALSSAKAAARNGYDTATQKRRYETTYRQCANLPAAAEIR